MPLMKATSESRSLGHRIQVFCNGLYCDKITRESLHRDHYDFYCDYLGMPALQCRRRDVGLFLITN